MPVYEYQCRACGQIFDRIQKFSDEALTVHEGCGGAVVRLISAPALHFKGSGWYVTDYAKGGAKSAVGETAKTEKSEKSEKKSDSPKTESKTDATPAVPPAKKD